MGLERLLQPAKSGHPGEHQAEAEVLLPAQLGDAVAERMELPQGEPEERLLG